VMAREIEFPGRVGRALGMRQYRRVILNRSRPRNENSCAQ
jgi:hypothetical protein